MLPVLIEYTGQFSKVNISRKLTLDLGLAIEQNQVAFHIL